MAFTAVAARSEVYSLERGRVDCPIPGRSGTITVWFWARSGPRAWKFNWDL